MLARTSPSLLSLPELITASNSGTEVQGEGAEAEADRLLISNRFSEAAEAYRSLDLDDLNRREKLAYSLFCAGQEDFRTVLDTRMERATPWGLALHLWAFSDYRFTYRTSVEETIEKLTKILQYVVQMDSWPKLREYLIAGCWYQSLQQLGRVPAMVMLHSTASAALGESGSKLQDTLELCTRIFNYYSDRSEPKFQALRDLVASITPNNTPVLSALFSAAMIVRDTQQAKSALFELCRRYKDHQYLEQTVSAVAIEENCTEFLNCLPENLKTASLSRPEIRLLIALEKQEQNEVHALAVTMSTSAPADSVLNLPRIAEPFFDFLLSGRTSQVGGWGGSAPWEAILGARLVKALPAGPLRNSFLQGCRDILVEEELLLHTKDLCDLFESSLADEDFYWMLRPECLQLVNAHSFAKYLVQRASEASECWR